MMSDVASVILSTRLSSSPEKLVQEEIGRALDTAGIPYKREVHLAPGDIIDFISGETGVEVKIKGSKRAILRQLERYAASEHIAELLLVSSVAMGLPSTIGGKPAHVVSMGRAWL